MANSFRFVDLFSGIGGFHFGLSKVGGQCVMASDIDPVANKSYKKNFGILPKGDIYKIKTKDIPNFDLLCAGFPCQSFSNVGPGGGISDSRGALIYQVLRVLRAKKPKSFILENVRGLLSHDGGKTLDFILRSLRKIGYTVHWSILEATDFGLPQIRKRLFIVGIDSKLKAKFMFPRPIKLTKTLSDIFRGEARRKYAFTIRIGGRRSGLHNRYNWDCYVVDGQQRYINAVECLELQGFPRKFYLAGNESEKMKQVGNSVPTTIIAEIAKQLIRAGVFKK